MNIFRSLFTHGATIILAATVISGVSGYVVTGVVARILGPAMYGEFAVFWAALYLVIGTLAGIQQEVTRAAQPRRDEVVKDVAGANARTFALVVCACVVLALIAVGFLAGEQFFPSSAAMSTFVVLAGGAGSYVVIAVLSGVLYGLSMWTVIGLMTSLDAVIRLLFVAVVLILHGGILWLEIAVAAPFIVVPLALWPLIRGKAMGRYALDVQFGQLVWNTARTLIASASLAVLISGFPLILGATSHSEPAAEVGTIILAITLTRAPLTVTSLALQSYFVVMFKNRLEDPRKFWGLLGTLTLWVSVAALALAALVWWCGAPIFRAVFGRGYDIPGSTLAMLVGSAGIVALLALCGAALLVRGQHVSYAASWVVAAVITVVLMLTGLPIIERVVVSLVAGPLIGLIFQILAIRVRWRDVNLSRQRVFSE